MRQTGQHIGRLERSQASKSTGAALEPITREEWINKHLAPLGPETVAAAERYITLVAETGGHAEVTRPQGSIIAIYDLADKALYPLGMTRYGTGKAQVALQLGYLKYHQAFYEDAVRREIYDRVAELVGPLSTRSLAGSPAFPLERLNEAGVYEGLANILRDIIARVQAEA